MTEDQKIPTPDTSGVSGTQISDDSSQVFQQVEKPLEGLHMAKAIDGLATTHSRSLGGEVTSALIAGITNQLACDYQNLQSQHKDLRKKYESQRDELDKTRTEKAILSERIRSDGKNKHLRNFCITIGTSLIGTGIFLSRSNLDNYAYGAYGLGLALLLLGWFTGPKESV